jgi:hypothetical protein
MKDHWENDEKMMRENTREPVVSFLILPGVRCVDTILDQSVHSGLHVEQQGQRSMYVTKYAAAVGVECVYDGYLSFPEGGTVSRCFISICCTVLHFTKVTVNPVMFCFFSEILSRQQNIYCS